MATTNEHPATPTKRYFKRVYDNYHFVVDSIENESGVPAAPIYNLQPLRFPKLGWGNGPWRLEDNSVPFPVTEKVIKNKNHWREVFPTRPTKPGNVLEPQTTDESGESEGGDDGQGNDEGLAGSSDEPAKTTDEHGLKPNEPVKGFLKKSKK